MKTQTNTANELLASARAERAKVVAEVAKWRDSGDYAGGDFIEARDLPKWDQQISRLEALALDELERASGARCADAPAIAAEPAKPYTVTRLDPPPARKSAPAATARPFAFASVGLNDGRAVSVPAHLVNEARTALRGWESAGRPLRGALFDHMQRIIRACQ